MQCVVWQLDLLLQGLYGGAEGGETAAGGEEEYTEYGGEGGEYTEYEEGGEGAAPGEVLPVVGEQDYEEELGGYKEEELGGYKEEELGGYGDNQVTVAGPTPGT